MVARDHAGMVRYSGAAGRACRVPSCRPMRRVSRYSARELRMRAGQGVDVVVTAGHPPQPGIRHRRGGGGDLGEDAQRAGGVTAAVGIHSGVERPALLGGRGHRVRSLLGYRVVHRWTDGSRVRRSVLVGGRRPARIGDRRQRDGLPNADGSRCVRTSAEPGAARPRRIVARPVADEPVSAAESSGALGTGSTPGAGPPCTSAALSATRSSCSHGAAPRAPPNRAEPAAQPARPPPDPAPPEAGLDPHAHRHLGGPADQPAPAAGVPDRSPRMAAQQQRRHRHRPHHQHVGERAGAAQLGRQRGGHDPFHRQADHADVARCRPSPPRRGGRTATPRRPRGAAGLRESRPATTWAAGSRWSRRP